MDLIIVLTLAVVSIVLARILGKLKAKAGTQKDLVSILHQSRSAAQRPASIRSGLPGRQPGLALNRP